MYERSRVKYKIKRRSTSRLSTTLHTLSLFYRISSNSRPSINRLPQIIAATHAHTPRHPLFHLSPRCQVEVESDPAKLKTDQ